MTPRRALPRPCYVASPGTSAGDRPRAARVPRRGGMGCRPARTPRPQADPSLGLLCASGTIQP